MNEATIAKKHEEVQVVREQISKAGSTLFVDYLGLTVAEITQLRVKLHAENCTMKVVKNNIKIKFSSPNFKFHFFVFHFQPHNYLIKYSQPGCHAPVFLQSFSRANCQVTFFVITSKASCGAL